MRKSSTGSRWTGGRRDVQSSLCQAQGPCGLHTVHQPLPDFNEFQNLVVGQFEFLMASSLVDGVIPSTSSGQALSVAVLQAERRACPEPDGEGISRYDAVCHRRSLGPLVKTRALRDDALRDSEFKLGHYRKL